MLSTFRRNFLFDHLPKTGGTAFRTVVEELLGRENVSPHIDGRAESWALQRYSKYRVISGHFVSQQPGDLRTGGRTRLTILRHPVERAISEYFYRRHHSSEGVDDKLARWAKQYDICTFFRIREETNETALTNYYTKHFASRLTREIGEGASMLALAREALAKYEFVGISEQMDSAVDLFCWRFGFAPVQNVPLVNVTSSRVEIESLDFGARSTLERMNELDQQLYCHALEEFEREKRRMVHEFLDQRVRSRRRFSLPGLFESLRKPGPRIEPPERNRPKDEPSASEADQSEPRQENFGNGMIRIAAVRIAGGNSGTREVAPGESVCVTFTLVADTDEPNLTVGIEIRDCFEEIVFGTNSHLQRTSISVISGHTYEVTYGFRANLNRGRYFVGGALHTGADHLSCCYQWSDRLGEFDVVQLGEYDFVGYCRLEPHLAWRDVTLAAPEGIRAPDAATHVAAAVNPDICAEEAAAAPSRISRDQNSRARR